jgi:CRP/FNR family cyclic AMP-dependent transcriptional regulator
MDSKSASTATFRIWGVDNVVYGPVELPVLVGWIKEERVVATTWVFADHESAWHKASEWPELAMFFKAKSVGRAAPTATGASEETARFAKQPGTLRRVKLLAEFSDQQLEHFVEFMHVRRVGPGTQIVKQGQEGDGMYMVLEGEVRVRILVGTTETTLVTLGPGEFFGEMSLFDSGPRSADVLANQEAVLLKISNEAFDRLLKNAPQLAAPFLYGVGKTLAARIRADNKRFRDSIAFSRAAGK